MAFFCHKTSEHPNLVIKMGVLALSAISWAAPSQAAEISTLKQSVVYSLEHNRQLIANAQSVEQAHAGVDAALGYMLPRIDLSAGAVRTDAAGSYLGMKLNQSRMAAADFNPATINNPGYINNYQTRVNLTMPLYQGGALWAGREQASHNAEASQLGHEYLKQQIVFQTVNGYARLRQSLAQITAMESAVSAAKKRYQDTKALFKRGVLIDSDVMDAHVHLLRTTVNLQEAQNAYARSEDMLEFVLGLNGDVTLHTEEEPQLLVEVTDMNRAIEQALQSRPDLKALERHQQAASAGINRSRAAFLPHVNLVAAQEWNASTVALKNRNTMVGATVTLNLFSGGTDAAAKRVAEAGKVALELKTADLRQQIKNEVALGWRQLGESKMRFESETEALKQSEESLRIKSLRFKQGLAKTSDLLDAQLQVDSARVSTIRTRYDVTVAQASLLLAMGLLHEEIVR